MRKVLIIVVAAILLIAFAPPLAQGFHLGCNSFDHYRMTRLGVEFCR